MKRFKKILFVYDHNAALKTALERALNLAKANEALLTVVEVLEKPPGGMDEGIAKQHAKVLRTLMQEESTEKLEDFIKPIKEEGVTVASKILWGTAWLQIIREVLRNNHDLVILTPQGKTKFKEMLFGTRTMHLMRKCPCPVWAIKPTRKKQYTRILAAVDAAPEKDKETLLNIKIMELATSLAQLEEKTELHIVHCWQQFFAKKIRGRTILNEDEVDELNRDTKKIRENWVSKLTEKFNLKKIEHKIHLLGGEPDEVIPDFVNKKKVDIVVMGTVSRTGLSGFFIGNTAEKMLQELDCSVLAIKPDGFVTPVTLD